MALHVLCVSGLGDSLPLKILASSGTIVLGFIDHSVRKQARLDSCLEAVLGQTVRRVLLKTKMLSESFVLKYKQHRKRPSTGAVSLCMSVTHTTRIRGPLFIFPIAINISRVVQHTTFSAHIRLP